MKDLIGSSNVGGPLSVPPGLCRLPELANNLWWSWTPCTRALFEQLDQTLWRLTHHNPVKQLQSVQADHLVSLSRDVLFVRQYQAAVKAHDDYMMEPHHWFGASFPEAQHKIIAYFSAEFGLHQSLPVYSGGLGILAGDHLKEASDLGVPLVGVGFKYNQAYFRQIINSEGWQEAIYESFDQTATPIQPALTPTGVQARIQVPLGFRVVTCVIWQVQVGRVTLYLLDTDTPENSPANRELSARLYGGDQTIRLSQEILLGIGGIRALRAVGIHPAIWHINEGHPAFLVFERLRELVQEGLSVPKAVGQIRSTTAFTTHTPVPAGHDVFPSNLLESHFSGFWKELGLTFDDFLALGKHPDYSAHKFHMTALAMRLAGSINGVSKEHGRVSRRMFAKLWPGVSEDCVPIQSITNGIHVPTWIAPELDHLYNKYLGPRWRDRSDDQALWPRVLDIPDHELWEVRQFLKEKLLNFIRQRVRSRWMHGWLEATQVLASGALCDPYPLTIGFCRRFATYKRATLIFRNIDRLRRILLDQWKPVQIIFAGKAHPADHPGRHLIHDVYQYAKDHGFGGRIAFVEDYDMHVSKFLVQGVDVWLNNPRPPLEASGTSGQKAALNGVLNISTLDGWWKEGYDGANGWAIPLQPESLSEEEQDNVEAEALYTLLENEVIPLFYSRDADGIPHGWIKMMKHSIHTLAPCFNSKRMVKEYVREAYETFLCQGKS